MNLWSLAASSKADHVATANVRNILFGFQAFSVPHDKIVNHALANGLVAQRDLVKAGLFEKAPEHDGRRQQGIDAFGVQAGNGQTSLHRGPSQLRFETSDIL